MAEDKRWFAGVDWETESPCVFVINDQVQNRVRRRSHLAWAPKL